MVWDPGVALQLITVCDHLRCNGSAPRVSQMAAKSIDRPRMSDVYSCHEESEDIACQYRSEWSRARYHMKASKVKPMPFVLCIMWTSVSLEVN